MCPSLRITWLLVAIQSSGSAVPCCTIVHKSFTSHWDPKRTYSYTRLLQTIASAHRLGRQFRWQPTTKSPHQYSSHTIMHMRPANHCQSFPAVAAAPGLSAHGFRPCCASALLRQLRRGCSWPLCNIMQYHASSYTITSNNTILHHTTLTLTLTLSLHWYPLASFLRTRVNDQGRMFSIFLVIMWFSQCVWAAADSSGVWRFIFSYCRVSLGQWPAIMIDPFWTTTGSLFKARN